MLHEPRRPDRATRITTSLDAVLRSLTAEQTAYLQRPKNAGPLPTPDDAQSLAELQQISGVAARAIVELQQGNPLTDDDLPDYQRVALSGLVAEIRRLTEGHERRPGREARERLFAWLGGDGRTSEAAFRDLRDRLRARLQAQAAAAPVVQPAPQQAQPTNQDVLSGQLAGIIGHAAPAGDEAQVKAILVVGGQAYRGRNGGPVSAVTLQLINGLVEQLEDWTITGCAEVHALDAFVTARNYTDPNDVLKDFTGAPRVIKEPVIAAMDARGRPTRSWAKRLPCEHCRQWLATLHITPDTKGAVS